MKSLIVGFLLGLPAVGFANSDYKSQNISTKNCQVVGHVDYVQSICGSYSGNGDRIMIQGNHKRSNLVVTNRKLNDNAYFMPLGRQSGTHSVAGDIEVIQKKNGSGRWTRHALVYRLNYKTDTGKTGFQIITVRTPNTQRNTKTCTMAVYDSATSNQTETELRELAQQYVEKKSFSSDDCFPVGHDHGEARDTKQQQAPDAQGSLVIDPEEGDSLELSTY